MESVVTAWNPSDSGLTRGHATNCILPAHTRQWQVGNITLPYTYQMYHYATCLYFPHSQFMLTASLWITCFVWRAIILTAAYFYDVFLGLLWFSLLYCSKQNNSKCIENTKQEHKCHGCTQCAFHKNLFDLFWFWLKLSCISCFAHNLHSKFHRYESNTVLITVDQDWIHLLHWAQKSWNVNNPALEKMSFTNQITSHHVLASRHTVVTVTALLSCLTRSYCKMQVLMFGRFFVVANNE